MYRLFFGYVRLVLRDKLRMLVKDESGVTAIEYGLIAAAIALAIAGVVLVLGADIANLFGKVSALLKAG